MEFQLPFPTLKTLSSLRICLHWADHKLGPFQDFEARGTIWRTRERHSHLIIDGLQIPRSLKPVVGDVLIGVLEQTCYWRDNRRRDREKRLLQEVQFFHFDAFGRFDEKQTLKPIFQEKIAEKNDLSSLHELLTESYNFWLLPEVDAIFRKMVAIASKRRRSEILMEGPQPELHHGKYHLVYHFAQDGAAQSLQNFRFRETANRVRIVVERESVAVAPCSGERYWNFDAFKDHFELFEPSGRNALIKDVLSRENRGNMGIKHLLDIFAFLEQTKNDIYHGTWMLQFSYFDEFFDSLFSWPFTSLFIVIFKYVSYSLNGEDHHRIFSYIVALMPDEPEYGVLHRNLLVQFWSVLTADEKQTFATWDPLDSLYSLDSVDFNEDMEKFKVKAPFLHDTIKTELDSLRPLATDEG